MEDYKDIYYHLFNRVSDALRALEERNYGLAEEMLRQAQLECETMYLDGTQD